MKSWLWLGLLVAVLLAIIIAQHLQNSSHPECYVAYDECGWYYDYISRATSLDYPAGSEVICCRKPHYLLQGYKEEVLLMRHDIIRKEKGWT